MPRTRTFINAVSAACLILLCPAFSGGAAAQIVLDGSVGPSGRLTGPNYAIPGSLGRQAGGNLFHSFSEFSIWRNESATFSGPPSIQNIISRVTGGSSSYIDGILRSTIQGANMYFINPAGVMFGPNAALDITGSFHVTTADYVRLGETGRFDATHPEQSVLTVDPPSAFGFLGPTPAAISFDSTFLEVPSGRMLSVIGGDIAMYNVVLRAPGGRINLVSAASAGEVGMTGDVPATEGFPKLGSISLVRDTYSSDSSDIYASNGTGPGAGTVFIRAGEFILVGGRVRTDHTGQGTVGGIDIETREDVYLDGGGVDNGGSLSSAAYGEGKGGGIRIVSRRVAMAGGAYISATAEGTGQGGNVLIDAAESVTIYGKGASGYGTAVVAGSYGTGDGGNVTIYSPDILVSSRGVIGTEAYGAGKGGSIRVEADIITVADGLIYTYTEGSGRGGDISLSAGGTITLSGSRAAIATDGWAGGDSGDMALSTPALSVTGDGSIHSRTYGQGKAGSITMNVDTLLLSGSGYISSETKGAGNAGNIDISATGSVIVEGDTYIGSAVYPEASGNGGRITIRTPGLTIADAGLITADSLGTGNGGSIILDVGTLTITGSGLVSVSTEGTGDGGSVLVNASREIDISGHLAGIWATTFSGSAKGGSIDITTPLLVMARGSILSADNEHSTGAAGNVTLNVNVLSVSDSSITTGTYFGPGRGGNITINATDSVDIAGNSFVAASTFSGGGDGGSISLTTPSLTINGGQVQASTAGPGKGGNVSVDVGTLSLIDGGTLQTVTSGAGHGGTIVVHAGGPINVSGSNSEGLPSGMYANTMAPSGAGGGGAVEVWAPSVTVADSGQILADSYGDGKAGDITLNVGTLTLTGGGQLTTSANGTGAGGAITIASTGAVAIRGSSDQRPSGVYVDSLGGGDGGSIFITTPTLAVDGGLIWANTVGSGGAGNIQLNTGSILLSGGGQVSTSTNGSGPGGTIRVDATGPVTATGPLSGFYASAGESGSGRGGSITIVSPVLRVTEGAEVQAVTYGTGNAGDVSIHTGALEAAENGSYITVSTFGSGSAGNISIDASTVSLTGGAQVHSETSASGRGGGMSITARDSMTIFGKNADETLSSGLFANTYGQGAGGNISVAVPVLTMSDRGLIQAGTGTSTGNAGDIHVEVSRLSVTGGAQIFAGTFGSGQGGNIFVAAKESVTVSGMAPGSLSIISARTSEGASGDGGRIIVSAPSVLVTNGGAIDASTRGSGRGGEILLEADRVGVTGGGQISSSTRAAGPGGNITVKGHQLYLSGNGKIASESTGTGEAGNITIQMTEAIRLDGSSITAATENADGGNIIVDPWLLDLTNSAITATVKGGTGNGGNLTITANNVILDHSRMTANAEYGSGGNISITSTVFLPSPDSVVSASSHFGLQGNVEISAPFVDLGSTIAELPETFLSVEGFSPKACVERAEQMSSFVVKGRDGLPPQPDALLMSPYAGLSASEAYPRGRTSAIDGQGKMEKTAEALGKGDFRNAIARGREAATHYEGHGTTRERVEVLLRISYASQAVGEYEEAKNLLHRALEVSGGSIDDREAASIQGMLGNAYLLSNRLPEAEKILKQALRASTESGEPSASVLNFLGNLATLRMAYGEAVDAFGEGLRICSRTGQDALAARITANLARAWLLSGAPERAEVYLDAARTGHIRLPDSHDKAYGMLGIGRMYRRLGLLPGERQGSFRACAVGTLEEALAVASRTGDALSASYAAGYLGEVFEDGLRFSEAMDLTKRAIFEAQAAGAPESIYRWQWQYGRLMNALGETDGALPAYRKAVQVLQSIRYEFSGGCRIHNQLSYKDAVEPVYLGFVDTLLRHAAASKDAQGSEPYILEAIQTVELLRTAELQDYFQNTCVSPRRPQIARSDLVIPNHGVVYFIALQDRMELLLGLPDGLRRFTVATGMNGLADEIRGFRRTLENRTSREYLSHGRKLYEWLIRPFEKELSDQKVETLIFVPDGPLRTIPLAALHDGTDFLISRYAAVTTPGLTLVEPRPLGRRPARVLLAGLSQSVQGFPALTHVPYELANVREMYGGKALMDEAFRMGEVAGEIENNPYTIVHVASHGEFSENASDTYVLTWDGKMNMDQLEKFVGATRYRKSPVELLALSACRSAGTNDRAALGLAGLSVKAGARSALATLWYINDQATSDLVVRFYRHLSQGSISKAKALQQAQLALLKGEQYRHPTYWAAFLLVGSWL
jgi:filamentous hemagglutinin family protein